MSFFPYSDQAALEKLILRSINGLEKIENGKIFFDDEKIDENYLPEVQNRNDFSRF